MQRTADQTHLDSLHFTSRSPHLAGTGEDLFSALTLKAEYEEFLGIPFSAPYDKIWPAGTPENQAAIRDLEDKDEPEVWIDTVSS
jgi:hypothetical protein